MKPSEKDPAIENFFEKLYGRTTSIDSLCMPVPIGCGKPIKEFSDFPSEKEYTISGLCQDCQDKIFVEE